MHQERVIVDQLEKDIVKYLKNRNILMVEKLLNSASALNENLYILGKIIKISKLEQEKRISTNILEYSDGYKELIQHFLTVKLLLRRFEFDLPVEYQREAYDYFLKTNVSNYFILSLLLNNCFYPEKVCEKLINLELHYIDDNKERREFFEKVLLYFK